MIATKKDSPFDAGFVVAVTIVAIVARGCCNDIPSEGKNVLLLPTWTIFLYQPWTDHDLQTATRKAFWTME